MTTETITVTHEDRTVAGRHGDIRVREYMPSQEAAGAVPFVWVHGGAFGGGSLDMAESHAVATELATVGRRVTTVEYRLVPSFPLIGRFRMKPSEHRYPVPVHDVCDAFLDVAGRHPDRGVVLGGASAGACLAASAALMLRDGGGATPAGVALVYGTFHATLPPMSPELRARVPWFKRVIAPEMVRRMNLNYVGSDELFADPSVFAGTADVAGLPRTLLLNADRDTFRASADELGEHLRAAGVPLEEAVVPDTAHAFLDSPPSAGFDEGIRVLNDWLSRPT